MQRRGRKLGVAIAIVAASTMGAGAVVAGTGAGDDQALQPARTQANGGIERKVDRLLRQMTVDEKLQQVQLLSDGQITDEDAQEGRRRRVQPHRPGQDRPLPARRRRAVAAAHPDPVRLRHDPRLPHGLPGAAGRGVELRPRRRDGRLHDLRARVRRRRHQADLQPDGRRLPRAALGPHRRGLGRGPVPRLGDGRHEGPRRPGRRLLRARQGRHERQAPRGLRRRRGRARLQHDRRQRASPARSLPAAVQGRGRRRRRHGHVLVQLDQRPAGLRQPARRDRHPQEGVGLRRLHRERLHGGRRAARLPAEEPGRGTLRPRRRGRRPVRRRAGAQRRHGLRDGQHQHPRQRQAAAVDRPDLDAPPRRRRPPDPARQVPRRAVRQPLRRPGRDRGQDAAARGSRSGAQGRRPLDGPAQER